MGSARADLIPGGGANFLKGAGGQLRAPPRASPRTCPRPPCPPPPGHAPPSPPPCRGGEKKIRKSAKIIIIQIIRKKERGRERERERGIEASRPRAPRLRGGERRHLPAQRDGKGVPAAPQPPHAQRAALPRGCRRAPRARPHAHTPSVTEGSPALEQRPRGAAVTPPPPRSWSGAAQGVGRDGRRAPPAERRGPRRSRR